MKPTPSILRRAPRRRGAPLVQVPANRLKTPSRFDSVLGAFQLRTQNVMDYLAVTLLKTW